MSKQEKMSDIACDKMNLINGELKEAKSSLENLKYFVKRWELKINEVKTLSLDNQQADNLLTDYLSERGRFIYKDGLSNKKGILGQLTHDLYLAIFQANNNYKQRFPSFWNSINKLKLPKLEIDKK